MDELEQFYTQEKSEEGMRVPLLKPDGSESGHWLLIRGTDSQAFRLAERMGQRKGRDLAFKTKDENQLAAGYAGIETEVIASLVKAWSFEKPCTLANVVDFFKKAPQIQDTVNVMGAKRALFFKNGSTSSEPSPDPSSN